MAGTISIIITFSLNFKTVRLIFHEYWAQCGRKHERVYIIIITTTTFVIMPPPQPVIQQQQQGQGQGEGQEEEEENNNRIVKECCTVVVMTVIAVELHIINLFLIKHHIMLT